MLCWQSNADLSGSAAICCLVAFLLDCILMPFMFPLTWGMCVQHSPPEPICACRPQYSLRHLGFAVCDGMMTVPLPVLTIRNWSAQVGNTPSNKKFCLRCIDLSGLRTCTCYRAPLQFNDIWDLPPDDMVDGLSKRFRPIWQQQQERRGGPSLVSSRSIRTLAAYCYARVEPHGTLNTSFNSLRKVQAFLTSPVFA